MKNALLFLCFIGTISIAFGQNKKVTITGKVFEKNSQVPLEYATIIFQDTAKKRTVTGGITDAKGAFSIEVEADIYDITIEFISFKSQEVKAKALRENMSLGNFYLSEDSQALEAIEVIAEKTTVQLKLDKKIYNVGKDLTVRGGTVSDVLDNVPSVSVDVEGNVSLRGNDDVRILINGKPSGLVGLNSTDALRQLPAEAIEKVEIITSPSARYDAEGSAGILNIILRRSKLQGINGAVTTNVSHPEGYGISGNVNYRTGDFNFFTTSGYNYRNVPGNANTFTEYLNEDEPNTFLNENREFERIRKGFNSNFGVEWYINDKTSITTSLVYRDSDNERETSNILTQFDADFNVTNVSTRFDPETESDKTVQYAVNFDKNFEKSGHKLTADFQYETTTEAENSFILVNGDLAEQVTTIEDQKRTLLQTDYVVPLSETAQFEFGYRGNFLDLTTDYLVAFLEEDEFVADRDLSNVLNYREYVNAFYTQYGNKINEKFSFLLGLRMEDSRIGINQLTSGDFERKNYISLFPTINIGYEISEDQSITLGYNRRIRRPRSRFINPFPSRSSITNVFQGNPDINPSFSNAIDVGYLNRFGKLTLNSSIYFQRSTDVFNFISEDTGQTTILNGEEVPIIRRTPINLARNDRFGFEFTLTYNPSRKWRLNGNFNLFQSYNRGDFNGVNFDADNLSWFVRVNNKVTLPWKIDWQTRLFYRGPNEDAQNIRKGLFSANLAFSKDLLNDKASIALNVSDVFNSRVRRSESFTDTFRSEGEFQWRVRTFNLSFTYRFNQKKGRERNGRDGDDGDDGGFSAAP
ncbi:outer membrane protein beta-barrel family protein [Kordia sp. SMS9]|uniref:TonB-dependent receptor domain-containing protein n=1 Tax=Kordia sp. SMS9 TaxID=2282170 RepID=UPI000E0CD557|nr:TonB-dependent receptor [Kordia sp. SMS9]AXG71952.1 outer membrane protein beta-barrel family protein [Kordia sp. SMS9]